MSFNTYRGGLYVGAGFKPDGDSGFPLMETCDIQATADGKRLDEVLEELRKNAGGGASGSDGVGISKIEKTSSNGLVDTYTITLTDKSTYHFTVTNGKNGSDGKDGTNGNDGKDGSDGVGISSIAKTAVNGLIDTYTITLTDGNTYAFTVQNGETTIIDTSGEFDINDIVNLVLDKLPVAEEVKF